MTPTRPLLRSAVLAAALLSAPALAAADTDLENGKKKFDGLCAQCHKTDGEGTPGMGMDLRTAPLVKNGSTGAIAKFIATGHPPTREFPLGMPADGGEDLDQKDRTDIAAYLKTLAK